MANEGYSSVHRLWSSARAPVKCHRQRCEEPNTEQWQSIHLELLLQRARNARFAYEI